MSNKPAQKFKLGSVTATIWDNGGWFSVDVSRSYKDGDEWKSTTSLHHSDLLNMAKCLERAETWIGRRVNES